MAAMKELVPEYRAASAKLAMRTSEKKAAGASPAELRPLQEALRDVREVQRLLDGYYEVPRSAGIAALDTVYSDVNNEEGFLAEVELIRKLGFDGKSVINPRQIGMLHKALRPSERDLKKAYAVMEAIAEANARGSGVASLNGKMIDKPVVIRAQRLIELFEADNTVEEEEE